MDEPLFNELLESVKQADQIMADHAELRRLAKAATPGPWEYQAPLKILAADRTSIVLIALSHANYREDEANSRLIAAANPKTILALLDEIDRLKAENDALREALSQISNASCSDARSVVIARTVLTKGTTK
ncbi:TPA: ead/Ea22-like family protein [Pseudomonas aeruginosa]|nr:ead/Ea22-like family protein [Pseudomonas aeruginosa]HBO4700060.1 ead/Ea22-like family protein [Pseudomonas aeruginosa]